ncbi:MAG: ATP-binding cassette subfamily B multidrug efflux pump [Flavobacteriales bacterium]|jgi:ATP-binding cassette subfamily B multidrug efflux pump
MKSLQYLNKYFWKYKGRLLLGLVFIVASNFFGVYSVLMVRDVVNLLGGANEEYLTPINDVESAGQTIDKDSFFEQVDIETPDVLVRLSEFTGSRLDSLFDINTYEDFLEALVLIAMLLAVLYIVLYFIKGVFLFLTRQTIIVMSRLIEYDLKNEIYDQYQNLDLAFYKKNKTGDLMNRISEDVNNVRMYLGPAVMYTMNLAVLVILVVSFMVTIDLELTLWALMPLPLMSVAIYLVSNNINRKSESKQKQQSKLSTIVQESISGIRVLKAYNREGSQKDYFKDESDFYKFKTLQLIKIEALFMPIIVLLVGLSTILTIYIGGLKVISGEIEIGDIFSFVFFVNMLTWPFASVGWVTSLVQRAEASQARINEFLNTKPNIVNTSNDSSDVKGDVEFDHVDFEYPTSGIKALKDVSFKIKAGQTLAIIGRTGSGKSTLANLMCRMYDVSGGRILIDGKEISKLDLDHLRSNIGYVPQDVFLFSDSIKNNIGFGVDDAEDELIVQAAKDSDIHDNIMDFENAYETILGERGINVSGGQKQRISIARALAKNPRLLIFDDCLSAVDTETEEHILTALKRIMKDRTSIIVSHRVSSIKHADQIIVLDDGALVEQGTHDELMAIQGHYSDLYNRQLLEDSLD